MLAQRPMPVGLDGGICRRQGEEVDGAARRFSGGRATTNRQSAPNCPNRQSHRTRYGRLRRRNDLWAVFWPFDASWAILGHWPASRWPIDKSAFCLWSDGRWPGRGGRGGQARPARRPTTLGGSSLTSSICQLVTITPNE